MMTIWLTVLLAVLAASDDAGAQTVYGPPDAPRVARALDTDIHTGDAEEMRYVILATLLEHYAAEQDIEVQPSEIDAYLDAMRRTRQADRQRRIARLDELAQLLASDEPDVDERARLSAERDSLQTLLDDLAELEAGAGEDPAAEQAARREVASAFIRQWRINRALYRQYGGRIVYQQGGPEPLDAYRQFLEEQQAAGAFALFDDALAQAFWNYYRDDALHDFYPPGSEEEAQAFETPWWLEH